MPDHKLILYPKDPYAAILEREEIAAPLRRTGFIGREIEVVGGRRYRPGERFVALLPFSERPDPARCSVEIPDSTRQIEFLGGSNVATPNCPACGSSIESWSGGRDFTTLCPGCGAEPKLWDLDWQRTNAFGRYTVDVWGIGLGDATPSASLLQVLRDTSGTEWDYFYLVS